MSRSLTAAARERYAPRALCVLWGSARSRTAAERFVEAVAGRWERSALDLEEQLRDERSALSWSVRSPARPGSRGPRGRRVAAGETPEKVLGEEQVGSVEEVPGSSPDRPRVEPSERERGGRLRRAPSPGSRTVARGREESPTESVGGWDRSAAAKESGGPDVARSRDPELPAIDGSPVRSELTADGSDGPGSLPGSPALAVPPASPRRRDRDERAGHPHGAGAGSPADRAPSGWGDAVDLSVWTQALPGDRARWCDPADDSGETVRRRFEQWSLERRWRDEALAEWRKWEF